MRPRLFWVDLPYCCFGMESVDNVITLVAPIAGWMKGKTLQQVKPWLLQKKAKVVEITELTNDSNPA